MSLVVGKYVPRHRCGKLAANKIRIEEIYHDKRCAQCKDEQNPTRQFQQ